MIEFLRWSSDILCIIPWALLGVLILVLYMAGKESTSY
jgi:hypothetical protein